MCPRADAAAAVADAVNEPTDSVLAGGSRERAVGDDADAADATAASAGGSTLQPIDTAGDGEDDTAAEEEREGDNCDFDATGTGNVGDQK